MEGRKFDRKVYQDILQWKNEYAQKYVLFLKGARRVGKTTLAEKLGKEQYSSYITISFDKAPDEIKNLFVNSLEDLDNLFSALQLFYKKKLYVQDSLIIFDEIQLFPLARQALKTLLEDGRYNYLETGSLAGIEKKSKDILIPSEEHIINVYPMDYEEFLWANNQSEIISIMKDHLASLKPMGTYHRIIMKSFREYMLVGGMPQAVVEYVKTRDFGKVDFIKQKIISLYESDIEEQNEENSDYVRNFLLRVPSELSKHDKRYVITHINENARIRDYKGPIDWLNKAMIINISNSLSNLSAAFNLDVIDSSFKCYMMDTGLLVSLAYKDRPFLDNELYKAILLDKLRVNEGMIVENIVAQCLKANKRELYFYKKVDKESKKTVAEVDFLIRIQNKVCPIEVKSGTKESIKSLKKLKESYSKIIGSCYVLHDGEIIRKDDIVYLPYYLAAII